MNDRRALLHCNAGVEYGMGHLMRALALAGTAQRRGWNAAIVGDIDEAGIDVVRRLAPDVSVRTARGAELTRELEERASEGIDVVHLDTYWDVPDLTGTGALVSNMQDGDHGVRPAHLAIDANLGAEEHFAAPELGGARMAGIDAAVIREQVLAQRGDRPAPSPHPRILVVMGGTDPHDLTARVIAALDGIADRAELTVIDPRGRAAVADAAAASRHDVTVIGFTDDLPALARSHDLAVTAAGTSVWDFACMGLPMGLVCAADNQVAGYREAVGRGLAVGLGEPPYRDLDERIASLRGLLASAEAFREESGRLTRVVDGLGAWRIVAAWEQLLDTPVGPARDHRPLTVRPAVMDDAGLLFEWRNDPGTRRGSRSPDELDWDVHRSWLERSLADTGRRLFVVESESGPVATSRWDRLSDTDWECSITLAPAQRGHGLAAAVLAAAEDALDLESPYRMRADIHVDNPASRRLFERAGYLPHLPPNDAGFLALAKWRVRPAAAG